MKTSVIITMAGDGERFRRKGYLAPKYMIQAGGRPLFWWALVSLRRFLDAGAEVVFAARVEHEPDLFIAEQCGNLAIDTYRILHVSRLTDGQATTALLAGELLSRCDRPCLIYNIDTYVEPEWLPPASARGEGWVPCFPGEGNGWSFARAGADGRVTELAEKRRISPHATIGLYWFSSFDLYRRCYERHFAAGVGTAAGERYIAPIYNTLIAMGGAVYMHDVPQQAVHPLGTPEDVEAFAATVA